MLFNRGEKRGQVTIFIIISLVLLVGIVLFFVFRNNLSSESQIPKSIEPVYTHFLSCLEENSLAGISVLESKGGRIYDVDFEPGSTYMPFSNTLDFLGNSIPYWYYFSGNNLEKESVPSKVDMEKELEKFIEEKIVQCSFDSYYSSGFIIYSSTPKADVKINEDKVVVDLSMPLSIEVGEESVVINSHQLSVSSSLGSLYNAAKEVYSYEQENLILEDYTIDILRLYAPVDGVLLSCSPKTWNVEEVFSTLQEAIEANIYSIRNKDADYDLVKEENKYFVRDFGVSYDVRFLTSPNWSHTYEVTQANGNLLIATPVGNQAGLGIIGFCYVPYHFVYDVKYPVLVQVSKGDEIFQFPLAVVISGNQPRKSLETSSLGEYNNELCEYMNTPISVNTYDGKLNPIDADISFDCVGSSCEIGTSSFVSGLTANFPQCANGIIHAKAEGYVEATKIFSTINEGKAEIILKELHELNLEIKIGGLNYSGDAIILFNSEDYSTTVSYPSTKKIELAEGQYEARVYIYKNSSLKIPSTAKEQCVSSSFWSFWFVWINRRKML